MATKIFMEGCDMSNNTVGTYVSDGFDGEIHMKGETASNNFIAHQFGGPIPFPDWTTAAVKLGLPAETDVAQLRHAVQMMRSSVGEPEEQRKGMLADSPLVVGLGAAANLPLLYNALNAAVQSDLFKYLTGG